MKKPAGNKGGRRGQGPLYLTRRVEFCAAHRYPDPKFGPPSALHGHNYVCEVTVAGRVDERTGMVLNLDVVDGILKKVVVEGLDHRYLNEDVREFRTTVPTSESIAVWIWERVAERLRGARLHRVRVYEEEGLYADYFGERA